MDHKPVQQIRQNAVLRTYFHNGMASNLLFLEFRLPINFDQIQMIVRIINL